MITVVGVGAPPDDDVVDELPSDFVGSAEVDEEDSRICSVDELSVAVVSSTTGSSTTPVGASDSPVASTFDATTCVGPPSFNGFYGSGIVNAYGVVR